MQPREPRRPQQTRQARQPRLPRQPGRTESDLDAAVERHPLIGHVGKSGATLERVTLADGRRLVLKRLNPADDMVMTLTGDTTGREFEVFQTGVLDRLPDGVDHAVIEGWRTPDGALLVMRDLGDAVLGWDDRLTREQWLFVVVRVAALHRAFLDHPPDGLASLDMVVGLFSPNRLRPHAADQNPLARLALRGWEIFADTVPRDVAEPVLRLLEDDTPLVRALAGRPRTLVHGDLATVNMAFEGDQLTLLDWSVPTAAPGAIDLARFVAGCASVVDVSREQMIEDYRVAAGTAYDAPAMRLALLGGLVWLGWNKAMDAAEHPDPATREREQRDLDWWVGQSRDTLEAGLL